MNRRSLLAAPIAALATPAAVSRAWGQGRPPPGTATIVVGFAAGGIGDALARLVAEAAKEKRGAQVIVENRPGAGGTVATERVARAQPEGQMIVLGSAGALAVLPNQGNVGYDPLTDITPLAQLIAQPLPLYVRADSPFTDWRGVLAFARANPGKFTWGTAGARSIAELMVEEAFKHEGVETTTAPFRGGAEAIQALLGGHIMGVASPDYGPLLRQGAVRLMVESGPTPIPGHPEVPTFRSLGYPLCFPVSYGFVGPGRMTPEAAAWWESLMLELGRSPAMTEFADRYVGVAAVEDGAGYGRIIRDGYTTFRTILRAG
ncbi:tripartite tricarboxylate transporter substrate binding protein [Roseomonas sp. HJA6]|uniref:Tripartite tricarboxylate transporter substrate binding protein n=1 Tax=Roseomonas alba TaxID=2846776 RepID=A0ABS7A3S0_9PROT|nr:tripartite tricarboxylate transporter substrate binding protein [Neoroseomonas alba]MBW6396895.1 tripartite tricarboxylate transporter substrate binding protein [Neoroseomonas alba]